MRKQVLSLSIASAMVVASFSPSLATIRISPIETSVEYEATQVAHKLTHRLKKIIKKHRHAHCHKRKKLGHWLNVCHYHKHGAGHH